jgi:hypothetical protein
LLYFNTGFEQYGWRFSMDFVVFLLLLAAMGMKRRWQWPLAVVLLAVSVTFSALGVAMMNRPSFKNRCLRHFWNAEIARRDAIYERW